MTPSDDESPEWHELDQASTRKSIRDIIRRDLPDDARRKIPALKQLLNIVLEEIAEGIATDVTMLLGRRDAESREGARLVVAQLNKELTNLQLVIQDPITGQSSRLAVSRESPERENESWIQLVSLDNPSRLLTRLTYPIPLIKLLPEPPHDRATGRGSP